MLTSLELFGALSVLTSLSARLIYFHSIYKGFTKPHLFSWLIWGVISSIGFAAQVYDHAGPGSWARGFAAATCFVIVVIALFKGSKDYTRSDWITLIVALSTIPLWVITKTPVWSVIIVCVIDTLGYLPTIRKSWHKPYDETALSYFVGGMASVFALLAIENYTINTWLYSGVLAASNIALAGFLLWRRRMIA